MTAELTLDAAVRRELLRLAMRNSTRSVPLQLLAVGIVVALGFLVDAKIAAGVAAVIGVVVAAWRLAVARRFSLHDEPTESQIAAATRSLEGNSALAGLLWAVCAFGIYPMLQGTLACRSALCCSVVWR